MTITSENEDSRPREPAVSDTSGPADTVMMGVMHDAMRRDFVRLRDVLAS